MYFMIDSNKLKTILYSCKNCLVKATCGCDLGNGICKEALKETRDRNLIVIWGFSFGPNPIPTQQAIKKYIERVTT